MQEELQINKEEQRTYKILEIDPGDEAVDLLRQRGNPAAVEIREPMGAVAVHSPLESQRVVNLVKLAQIN